ncbi:unnamed protein product [Arabidopsis halleri]
MVWKLEVSVRAKGFSLKLHLRNRISHQRLSILLRFRKHQHHLKSKHSDCGRCLRSLLALFRRRKQREVDTKKLIELVWNRAVAKKARGVGVVVTLILVIIINYLLPSHSWSNSESFRLDCYELFGIKYK